MQTSYLENSGRCQETHQLVSKPIHRQALFGVFGPWLELNSSSVDSAASDVALGSFSGVNSSAPGSPPCNMPSAYEHNLAFTDYGMKKILQRQPRSVARELIPFWHFEPARVDAN